MPKKHGNLWEKFIEYDNFRLAFRKAIRGRRRNKHVVKILGRRRKNETKEQFAIRREKRIEKFLRHIIYRLETGQFTTSPYITRLIKDPKPRLLYILPLYPDRIIQHALMNILQPIWDKKLIYQSYACRIGKGQHKCSNKILECVRKYKYCALTDIAKFYPSIPHKRLYEIVERKIKDKKLLVVIKDIIDSVEGDVNVPIGNLVSQHLGNLYLNELDQYVAHELKIKDSPRYMDNKAYFGNSKKELWEILDKVETYVGEKLQLKLSQKEIVKCSHGVLFIGYRHFPGYVLLKKRTAKRIRRSIKVLPKKLQKKKITIVQYASSLNAHKGWAGHADSHNFCEKTGLNKMIDDARQNLKEVKMRGFPKYTDISTKYDVENLKALFPKETKKFLESLMNDRFIWVTTGELENKEDGITDETHRVIEIMENEPSPDVEGEMIQVLKGYAQQEYQEDPNARIFRMGYTLEDVEIMIESLS